MFRGSSFHSRGFKYDLLTLELQLSKRVRRFDPLTTGLDHWHKRKVKEATYIRQRAPTMNRDQGYHLPAIYNQIIPPKSEATHVTPVRDQGP